MRQIIVPALLSTQDLRQVNKYRGTINLNTCVLNGITYEPGGLVLSGWAHGKYVFRLSQPKDAERDWEDFSDLPGLEVSCQS